MHYIYAIFLLLAVFGGINANTNVIDPHQATSTTPLPQQPVYQSQDPGRYVPQNYHYPDMYGSISPYEGYLYPSNGYPLGPSPFSSMTALFPSYQGVFQTALKIFSKAGFFLMGGLALLLVGGLFTTAVCSYTSLCHITFNGFGNIDQETVRALMTPEKISTAAALVQDAIGKYQRLQRTGGNK